MESFEEVSSILEHTASDGYLPRGNPIKSRIKQYSSFEWRQVQSDTAMRNKNKGEKNNMECILHPSPKEQ